MESSVVSQISPKEYIADIKKIYKDDVDAESELFEINIFDHTLHIAPGKSIADEEHDKLVYFYVYAIKDEKVIANLGVYEFHTDEQKLMYDISTLENLLLFDYYYTNPGIIKEFEITGKNNIFDYIDTHLTPDPKVVEIYNTFTRYGKENKDFLGKHYASYKKIISILSKDIKKGLGGKIAELKDNCKSADTYKLTLAILEPFYNVHFSLVDKGVSVTNFRDKTPPQTFTPKQYIIASTDQSFVSTASTQPGTESQPDAAEDKVLEMYEAATEPATESVVGEVESAVETEPPESSASALEKEGGNVFEMKPKLKAPSGTRIPGLKSKGSTEPSGIPDIPAISEAKPKRSTISRSSKITDSSNAKESKADAKESLNAKESKADAKAESKSVSKVNSKSDTKSEGKSKVSKLSKPRAKELDTSLESSSKSITLKEPAEESKMSRQPPPPPSSRSKIGFKSNS